MAAPPLVENGRTAAEPGAAAHLSEKFLNKQLADAELLLSYAVESGKQLDDTVYRSVLEAQRAATTGWAEDAGVNLLQAVATLSEKLGDAPVTAESLRYSAEGKRARRAINWYRNIAIVLAVPVIIYSAGAFLTSSYSETIRNSLTTANPLAVKLTDELGPAPSPNELVCQKRALPIEFIQDSKATATNERTAGPPSDKPSTGQPAAAPSKVTLNPSEPPVGVNKKDVIQDLQLFAMAIRDMYGAARQINRIFRYISLGSKQEEHDSFGYLRGKEKDEKLTELLELPPGLPNLARAATERVCVYQKVRYYAQSTEQVATFFSGAIATGVLPVLYALLGACAYLLRRFESDLKTKVLTVSEAHSSRFISAAIAGAVVGLFNFGQSASVSPLAISFLVGYSVDVFFAFLESMIQTLSRSREGGPPVQGPRSTSKN